MKSKTEKRVKIGIFYRVNLGEFDRTYWIGIVDPKDETNCLHDIKVIKGRGRAALNKAIEFLNDL